MIETDMERMRFAISATGLQEMSCSGIRALCTIVMVLFHEVRPISLFDIGNLNKL